MAFFCMIPTAVSMLRDDYSWMIEGLFGQVSCKFLFFSQGSSVACSIFSLTILACERFLVIVFPLWNVVTIRGTLWSIAGIWVAATGISSPFFYAMKVRVYGGVAYCIEDWAPAFDPERAPAIYTVASFVLMYALPLVVIAMFYFAIAVKVWRRRTPGHTSSANRQVLKESKKNVLKMSIVIVLAFAFCWFMIHLNMFLMSYSDVFKACGIPIWLQTTGFLLGYANSTINCCVYSIFSQEYRKRFKQSLKSLLPKCFRSFTTRSDGHGRQADTPL